MAATTKTAEGLEAADQEGTGESQANGTFMTGVLGMDFCVVCLLHTEELV